MPNGKTQSFDDLDASMVQALLQQTVLSIPIALYRSADWPFSSSRCDFFDHNENNHSFLN
jgi:hypothetical protein